MGAVIREIGVDALAAGGDGVGRESTGRVVLVPGTAPGDRVRVRLVEEHARWARGELVEVLAPGPSRVAPPCPLAATCGGCPWQHVAGDAQLAAKQALVAGPLRALVAAGLELRPIRPAAAPWGWRRRARLHWARPRGSGAVLGFFAPHSHRVTDVAHCPQLEPRLDAALAVVRDVLRPALYGQGQLHLAVGGSGEVHVVVDGACDVAVAATLVGAAGIAGVVVRDGRARRVAGDERIELEPGLRVAADEFAQASASGNQALRAEVAAGLGPRPGCLLELFAGGGNFTRDAVAAGWSVTASDQLAPREPPAGACWRTGLAERVIEELAEAGEGFDAVLLDPPRTGARAAATALGRLAPARLVYVSCDPATLGRDAAILAAQGLVPRWAQPLDLMPQTDHVEVVCVLERGAPAAEPVTVRTTAADQTR